MAALIALFPELFTGTKMTPTQEQPQEITFQVFHSQAQPHAQPLPTWLTMNMGRAPLQMTYNGPNANGINIMFGAVMLTPAGYRAFYCDGTHKAEKTFSKLAWAQGFVEGNYAYRHPNSALNKLAEAMSPDEEGRELFKALVR